MGLGSQQSYSLAQMRSFLVNFKSLPWKNFPVLASISKNCNKSQKLLMPSFPLPENSNTIGIRDRRSLPRTGSNIHLDIGPHAL